MRPSPGTNLSPDGRCVAFATGKPDGMVIYVAPLTGTGLIPIAEDERLLHSPRWSPDGNLLYYVSNRDGWSCVWAQRLDPGSKKLRGDAFAVLHSHRMPGFNGGPNESRTMAVATNRLFLTFIELKGNVWTAKVDLN